MTEKDAVKLAGRGKVPAEILQQIVLPTDKHFIYRLLGNGFSSKP